jgi:hypothetical protein
MKKNRRVSIFMTSVLQIFLLLGLVAGCGNDSGSNTQSSTDSSQSTTEETETPAAYVASGFPQVVVVSGTNYEVNFEFTKSVLSSSDWYDSEAGEWHYNEPGSSFISNDHTSVSQSIFFPANLIAYLQTGTPSGTGIPSYATGEYVKIKLATDPKTVTMQADDDALSYYWEAADLFEYEINAAPAYLTTEVISDVRGKLDEAMTAYSYGIDREAFSDLETNGGASAMLWGSALTYFAKAQLYAQMAKTALQEAQAQAR